MFYKVVAVGFNTLFYDARSVGVLNPSARISGCIVVADAMNCQIETAKAVLEAKADYLLCAKNNQQTLKADIEEYVQDLLTVLGKTSVP